MRREECWNCRRVSTIGEEADGLVPTLPPCVGREKRRACFLGKIVHEREERRRVWVERRGRSWA